MRLYIEDTEIIPAIKILQDSDPAPVGFTEKTSIEDWHNYGERALDCCYSFNYLTWRKKIMSLVISIVNSDYSNWSGLNVYEQYIACDLILAPYAIRMSEVTDEIDKASWKKLIDKSQGLPLSSLNGRALIVELMRERTSDELRTESMTKFEIDDFYKSVREHLESYIGANVPDFRDWIMNTVGTPFENSGFFQKSYYSVIRRDYIMDIYNGNY